MSDENADRKLENAEIIQEIETRTGSEFGKERTNDRANDPRPETENKKLYFYHRERNIWIFVPEKSTMPELFTFIDKHHFDSGKKEGVKQAQQAFRNAAGCKC